VDTDVGAAASVVSELEPGSAEGKARQPVQVPRNTNRDNTSSHGGGSINANAKKGSDNRTGGGPADTDVHVAAAVDAASGADVPSMAADAHAASSVHIGTALANMQRNLKRPTVRVASLLV